MAFTAAFLAVVAAIVIWWLSHQRLASKPWLEEGVIGDLPSAGAPRASTAKYWRGLDLEQVLLSVELCAIYWHFLLFVWLVLFALLLHH